MYGDEFGRLMANGHSQARYAPLGSPQLVLQPAQGSGTQGRTEDAILLIGKQIPLG